LTDEQWSESESERKREKSECGGRVNERRGVSEWEGGRGEKEREKGSARPSESG
jgi:hypothetical protein